MGTRQIVAYRAAVWALVAAPPHTEAPAHEFTDLPPAPWLASCESYWFH